MSQPVCPRSCNRRIVTVKVINAITHPATRTHNIPMQIFPICSESERDSFKAENKQTATITYANKPANKANIFIPHHSLRVALPEMENSFEILILLISFTTGGDMTSSSSSLPWQMTNSYNPFGLGPYLFSPGELLWHRSIRRRIAPIRGIRQIKSHHPLLLMSWRRRQHAAIPGMKTAS